MLDGFISLFLNTPPTPPLNYGTTVSAISNGGQLYHPRIADRNAATVTDWTVVCMEDAGGGVYNILGNTGYSSTPGGTVTNYTVSSTWSNPTSPTYDMTTNGYVNDYPVVAYDQANHQIQIDWVTYDDLNGLKTAGIPGVVGIMCTNNGSPTSVTCSGISTPTYQTVPYLITGGCCSPFFPAVGAFVDNLDNQLVPSLAGKNSSTDFIAVYFDAALQFGCANEVVLKNGYQGNAGFRMANEGTAAIVTNASEQGYLASISPNPYTSNMTITISDQAEAFELQLVDVLGRSYLHTTGNEKDLNAELQRANTTLVQGVYIIQLKHNNKEVLRQKIVKME